MGQNNSVPKPTASGGASPEAKSASSVAYTTPQKQPRAGNEVPWSASTAAALGTLDATSAAGDVRWHWSASTAAALGTMDESGGRWSASTAAALRTLDPSISTSPVRAMTMSRIQTPSKPPSPAKPPSPVKAPSQAKTPSSAIAYAPSPAKAPSQAMLPSPTKASSPRAEETNDMSADNSKVLLRRQQQEYRLRLEQQWARKQRGDSPLPTLRRDEDGRPDRPKAASEISRSASQSASPPPSLPPSRPGSAEKSGSKNATSVVRRAFHKSSEAALESAAQLHRTVLELGLPVSQEGYAQAATILRRKSKVPANRLVQGIQQLGTALEVLQAGARGYLARRAQHAERLRTAAGMRAREALAHLFTGPAFNSWKCRTDFKRSPRSAAMRRVIGSLIYRREARAWGAWIGMLAERERTRRLARRGLAALCQSGKRKSFSSWCWAVDEHYRMLELLERSMGSFAHRSAAAAWRAWQSSIEERERQLGAMHKSLGHMIHRGLSRGFGAWLSSLAEWRVRLILMPAAIMIQKWARGKRGRAKAHLVRAGRHARQCVEREAAAAVITASLIIVRNRSMLSKGVLAMRLAGREALLRKLQQHNHSIMQQQARAQIVLARWARRFVARRELERRRMLERSIQPQPLLGPFHDIDVFAPVEQQEYFSATPALRLHDPMHTPMRSTGAGGNMRPANEAPATEFEYFDDVLTVEQLKLLDDFVEQRIGFMRTECSVRGAPQISFYCYRGRASPAQFPFLPASSSLEPTTTPLTLAADGARHGARRAQEARMRHEMRGLAIHRPTRRVLCRPYHKFWHAGQRPEQSERELAELLAAPALPMLEKVDGVMVQGFVIEGRVYLATRSGRTSAAMEAESHLRGDEGQRWVRLAAVAVDAGYTPLFEFCPASSRPSGPEAATLILSALRHRRSGVYMPYARVAHLGARFGVPVVPSLGMWHPPMTLYSHGPDQSASERLQAVLRSIRAQLDSALLRYPVGGCLLMLPSGLMLKVSTPSNYATSVQGSPSKMHGVLQSDEEVSLLASRAGRALIHDAQLAEAVNVLLACATDAAASPNATQWRVGRWSQQPSRSRLSQAASVVVQTADVLRLSAGQAAPQDAHELAERTLADALELCLHILRAQGSPGLHRGSYPVTELHALLAEEIGLVPSDGVRSPLVLHQARVACNLSHTVGGTLVGAAAAAPPTQSVGGTFVGAAAAAPPTQPWPVQQPKSSAPSWPKTQPDKHAAAPAGTFDTPLLASMLAGFSRPSSFARY